MATVFSSYHGKTKTGFGTGYMDKHPIITRVKFFFIKNDGSIKWWIENGPDIWDVMHAVIELIANLIM